MAGWTNRRLQAVATVATSGAIAALIAMAEIQRLANETFEAAGPVASNVYGVHLPDQVVQTLAVWQGVVQAGGAQLIPLLTAQLACDVVFIACYVVAGQALNARFTLGLGRLIWVVGGIDLVLEDGVAAVIVRDILPSTAGTGGWAIALFVATSLKWLAVVVLVVALVVELVRRRRLPEYADARLVRWQTVKKHRFALLVVLLLVVLLLVPLAGVTDQAPDAVREWADAGGGLGALGAVVAFLVLSLALGYLGAIRAAGVAEERRRVESATASDPVERWRPDRWWLWLVVVGATGAVGVILRLSGAASVQWAPFIIAGSLLALIGVASGIAGRWMSAHPAPGPDGRPQEISVALQDAVRRSGRLIALAPLSVLALGIGRALVPIAALGDAGSGWLAGLFFAVGSLIWLVALVPMPPPPAWVRAIGAVPPVAALRPGYVANVSRAPGFPEAVFAALTALAYAVLIAVPLQLGDAVGELATVALGLIGLTFLLTFVATVVQRRDAAAIFRVLPWLRLRSTPAITLILLVGVLASTLGNASPHGVRVLEHAKQTEGTPYTRAVDAWLTGNAATLDGPPARCALRDPATSNGPKVRPMIFVATAGGGIRAAYWTVDVLSQVAKSACFRNAVFATSGVSGGSVGLAVLQSVPHPQAVPAVTAMSGPEGLAAATAGLLSRDQIAASVGVSFTAVGERVPGAVTDEVVGSAGSADALGRGFPDRAALLEDSWIAAVHDLAKPFPGVAQRDGAPEPWLTFFNSSSGLTGCRVVIGEVDLEPAGTTELPDCSGTDRVRPTPAPGVAPSSLPGAYGLFEAEPCLRGRLSAATAAMLSARFTYITPSALVTGCAAPGTSVDQLIDGGYVENTGLGTANTLLQLALPRIRAWNASQLRQPDPELVVPVVLSIDNDSAPWHAPRPTGGTSNEVLLPLQARLRDGSEQAGRDGLIAESRSLAAEWQPCTSCTYGSSVAVPDATAEAVRVAIPDQVLTVAPQKQADVSAPLGWTLSAASEKALDGAFRCYRQASGSPTIAPSCTDEVHDRQSAVYRKLAAAFAARDADSP